MAKKKVSRNCACGVQVYVGEDGGVYNFVGAAADMVHRCADATTSDASNKTPPAAPADTNAPDPTTVTCRRCLRHVDFLQTKTENGLRVCDAKKSSFLGKTCKPRAS